VGSLVEHLLQLEFTVVEARDRDRSIAFPLSNRVAAFSSLVNQLAYAHESILPGDLECQFVSGLLLKRVQGGVPAGARADGIVATAPVLNDLGACVFDAERKDRSFDNGSG